MSNKNVLSAFLSLFFSSLVLLIFYCEKLQFLPLSSLAFLAGTGLCLIISLISFYILFSRFLLPRFEKLPLRDWVCMLLIAAFLAIFSMVWFPMPETGIYQEHTLEIYPIPAEDGSVKPVALTWLHVEDKDISLQAFSGEGWWAVLDDSIVAYDASSRIHWRGRTGALAQMEFKAGDDGGPAVYSWDGREEQIGLFSDSFSRLSYERAFPPTFQLPEFLAVFLLLLLAISSFYLYLFHNTKKLSTRSFFFLSALIFIAFRIRQFSITTEVLTFYDSGSYFGLSRLSFWQILSGGEFCYSEWHCLKRPILVPLLFKLCHQDQNLISLAHLLISLLSWLFLAYRAMQACNRQIWQKLSIFVLLGLGCVPNVTRWDQMMMSESLTISVLMLLAGSALWLTQSKSSGGFSLRPAICFAVSAILAIFTRDTIVWLVMLLICLLLGLGFVNIWRKCAWILSIVLLIFCCISMETTDDRWKYAYYNVHFMRIFHDASATEFFIDEGMPTPEGWQELTGVEHAESSPFFNSQAMRPLKEWIISDGLGVYFKYLLHIPAVAIRAPWDENFQHEAFEEIDFRYKPHGFYSLMSNATAKFFSLNLPGILVILLGLIAIYGAFHLPNGEILTFPIFFLLSAYFMGLLIYTADSYDFERHAIALIILMKAACWLTLCLLLDRISFSTNLPNKISEIE